MDRVELETGIAGRQILGGIRFGFGRPCLCPFALQPELDYLQALCRTPPTVRLNFPASASNTITRLLPYPSEMKTSFVFG